MAKSIYGPLALAASGSVGDVTFRQTRYGQVIQAKPVPTGEPSPSQIAQRNEFRTGIGLWSALTTPTKQIITTRTKPLPTSPTGVWMSAWLNRPGIPTTIPLAVADDTIPYAIEDYSETIVTQIAIVTMDRPLPSDQHDWTIYRYAFDSNEIRSWETITNYTLIHQLGQFSFNFDPHLRTEAYAISAILQPGNLLIEPSVLLRPR